MALKCSVLGHNYGDASVERDREEEGSEVVITIREIETCSRCSEERIVSENKEVTTLATPEEPTGAGGTSAGERVSGSTATREPTGAGGTSAGERVSGSPTDSETSIDAGTSLDAGTTTDGRVGDEHGSSDVDDQRSSVHDRSSPVDTNEGAEILEAESDDPVGDDELADPSIEDVGLGTGQAADEPVEEDAVIIDDGSAETTDEQRRDPGAWPEEPDSSSNEDSWTPNEIVDDETPIIAPDAGTDENSALTPPDGQFRCPKCGYTTLVVSSSLRAGDFCPDCHRGSLVHEPED